MAVLTNVFRRGGVFYFRARVPAPLRGHVRRAELWRSLKTGEAAQARRRGRTLHSLTEALWSALQRVMTEAEVKALVDAWLKAELDKDTDVRLTADLETIDAHEAQVLRRGASSGLPYYDPSAADRLVDELIAAHGLTLAGVERDEMTRMMRRAHAELFKAVTDRSRQGWFPWSEDDPAAALVARIQASAINPEPQNVRGIAAPAAPISGIKLSDAAQAFVEEEARAGLSDGRQKEFKAAFRSFQAWLERDPDLSEITPRIAGEYRVALSQTPASGSTRPEYRDLSFGERITKAREAGDRRLLSSASIGGNYINPLRSLFQWAKSTGKVAENPFASIKPPRESKQVTRKDRDVFTVDQLKALFALPLFTGSAAEKGKPLYRPGPVMVDDWRFWVPLVALFTGARLNEICGLELADFEVERGVDFFHVRPNETRDQVKTEAGVRRVPVHPTLTDIGLMRRVARLRKAGAVALFPELRKGPRGYLSDIPSKFFAEVIDRAAGADANVVFHSFRHTFITAMRSARIEPLLRMAIVGHDPGETHEGYGDQDIAVLAAEVEKVSYPGLLLDGVRR